jgi:hypothetical protein
LPRDGAARPGVGLAHFDQYVLNVLAFEALNRRLPWGLRLEFGDAYDISARPANYARDWRLLAIGGEVAAADLEEMLEVPERPRPLAVRWLERERQGRLIFSQDRRGAG